MEKTEMLIKGMHCPSCEMLVEEELLKVSGVKTAKVNYREGKAEICFLGKLERRDVLRAVQRAGYDLGKDRKPFFSRNIEDYKTFGIAACLVFILWYLLSNLNFFNAVSNVSNNYSSIFVVFLVGLTAGISTCMALVGGLVLGASARFAEIRPRATGIEKFTPHIFFNIGRIITFFILGGVIGIAGSAFQISTSLLGILTIIIGLVMLSLGIQLTELLPRFSNFKITIPKGIAKIIGVKSSSEKEYSHRNSLILGGLTFFLPCGFTQAMQLFALSSGSFLTGSLTMGVFALGTTPGLLGIGGLTSMIKGSFSNVFFKFAGIVVIALALFNISNGYNLSGFILPSSFASPSNNQSDQSVAVQDGYQIVQMKQLFSGYEPNQFVIKKGIPVKWIIDSVDPNTCASTIVAPSLDIRKSLSFGENIIEFTPNEIGQIKFSCSMGMFTGVFNVIDQDSAVAPTETTTTNPQAVAQRGASCGSSGGCGCGGAKKAQVSQGPAVQAEEENSVQVIKTTYSSNQDISPNNFSVKAGIPVRMEIEVKDDGEGCMGSIMIPRLVNQAEILTKGKNITFNFTPQTKGSFPITCAMGVPRGSIEVK